MPTLAFNRYDRILEADTKDLEVRNYFFLHNDGYISLVEFPQN